MGGPKNIQRILDNYRLKDLNNAAIVKDTYKILFDMIKINENWLASVFQNHNLWDKIKKTILN